jgi:hypothetical protein
MAFGQPQFSGDDSKSEFNEAWLKVGRINKLQDTMNMMWLNPLELNENIKKYHYQIYISCCDGILQECLPRVNESKAEDIDDYRRALKITLQKYPVNYPVKNQGNNGEAVMKVNLKNWNIIEEMIFKYGKKVRMLIKDAGYDTKSASGLDDDDFG